MSTRSQLAALSTEDCLATPAGKLRFNELHFTESARRYGLATAVLSFGRDAAWKNDLIAQLPALTAPACLDLACGTGDLTMALAERYPLGKVEGLDITQAMLDIAHSRSSSANLTFMKKEMCPLDYANESLDIVTGGYALRNAPDLGLLLREVYRVLRPDGIAAFLDFSKPASPFAQEIQYKLLTFWCGLWGVLLHGTSKVHGYIPLSLGAYPNAGELEKLIQSTGFARQSHRRFMFGMTEVIVLRKN